MDETPVWSDMVSSTTVDVSGVKTVTIKTTGHEKCRVSVCLSAKANGTKLRPMTVFKGAKRELEALNKEFKNRCVISSSVNGWIDAPLKKVWVSTVVGSFSFKRRLLVWDFYECHIEESITATLQWIKVDTAIVPGDYTKYIQAPDVSWNKTFTQKAAELYDEWLEKEGLQRETAAGNLKALPRKWVVEWVLSAWQ